jgi:FkbM family methyltransferase
MIRRAALRMVGGISRRLGRPELLAAVSPEVREAEFEAVAIRAALAASLAPTGSYVDVGTNRGQILRDAVRIAPQGRHLAFEPIPALAAEVTAAFPGVEVRAKALGAAPGTAEFCHFTRLDGWSGLRRSPEVSDERGRPEYITVEVSTLDAELAGRSPRVIKIDVEGAELQVLKGARELLARTRPVLVIEHVASAAALYDSSSGQIFDLLDELRYGLFSVTGQGPVARAAFGADERVVNWLARPHED